jgi:hypothetical protein
MPVTRLGSCTLFKLLPVNDSFLNFTEVFLGTELASTFEPLYGNFDNSLGD